MPAFIYRIQPTRPNMLRDGATEAEARLTAAHFAYLQEQMAAGKLILAGRTLNSDETAFGIAIFQARDNAEMRQLTENDPGVAGGLFRAEWQPFRIALHAPDNAEET